MNNNNNRRRKNHLPRHPFKRLFVGIVLLRDVTAEQLGMGDVEQSIRDMIFALLKDAQKKRSREESVQGMGR